MVASRHQNLRTLLSWQAAAGAGWPECYPDLRGQTLALLQAARWWPAGIEIFEYCCPGRLLQGLAGQNAIWT